MSNHEQLVTPETLSDVGGVFDGVHQNLANTFTEQAYENNDVIGTAVQQEVNEALSPMESSIMLGQFALAASHLIEGGSVDELPNITWHRLDGAREELATEAENADYVESYISRSIDVFDLLQNIGDTDKAGEIINDLAFSLGEDNFSHFSKAFEKELVSDEQAYRLMSAVSRSGDYKRTLFKYITNKKSYEFTLQEGENDARSLLTERMYHKSLEDMSPQGEYVRQMFAEFLADGMSGAEKTDDTIKNQNMIKGILSASGFTETQASEVFDAVAQSKGETYGSCTTERLLGTLRTLADIRDSASTAEDYKQKVEKLYNKFGIRNFFRYTAADLAPQLEDSFQPEEVVITAFSDEGNALSKPNNSVNGLRYDKPVYFEAQQGMDIAKSLLQARRLAGKPIEKVLIRAHGSPEGFLLSRTARHGVVDTVDLDSRELGSGWESNLTKKGIVSNDVEAVFESCSLGAGNFPKSLYTRTGIDKILTSPAKIVGSAVEGAPGVIRDNDGTVKFGISAPDFETGTRPADGLVDSVVFDRN